MCEYVLLTHTLCGCTTTKLFRPCAPSIRNCTSCTHIPQIRDGRRLEARRIALDRCEFCEEACEEAWAARDEVVRPGEGD